MLYCPGLPALGEHSETLLLPQGRKNSLNSLEQASLRKFNYDDSYRKNLVVKKSHINYEEFYYVVDKSGNTIIPQNKYRYLGPYCEGLFAASIDGDKMGFIDIAENIIIPFDYHFNKNSIFFADYSFHWGLLG